MKNQSNSVMNDLWGVINCKELKSSGHIYWYNGKGKLIANGSDGANIHLDNNHGKRAVDFYANYGNQGSRLIMKDQIIQLETIYGKACQVQLRLDMSRYIIINLVQRII